MPTPFIRTESRYGTEPADFFVWTADQHQDIANIRSPVIRRIMQDRLAAANDMLVQFTGGKFSRLLDTLDGWSRFVRVGPIGTSYGPLDGNDLPSILSAIAIVEPIVAAVRGDAAAEQKDVA